ncbi:MAG TPA: hemerythrin domain-containing protein [Nitrospiria bacterium]|nr:hemerythrin domain-containing protein [Nitrospiria bacterium]
MNIINRLEEEHKTIVQKINRLPQLLIKAKQNIDPLLELSREIEKELTLHEKIEDHLLFPALKDKVPEETLQSLVKEHEEMRGARALFLASLSEIQSLQNNQDLARIKEMSNHGYKFMRILSTHLTREDKLLFPMARGILSPERSAELFKLAEAFA